MKIYQQHVTIDPIQTTDKASNCSVKYKHVNTADVIEIDKELKKKAEAIVQYLGQPDCKLAIWEVKEAARLLWNVSNVTALRLEQEVTKLDRKRFLKRNNI